MRNRVQKFIPVAPEEVFDYLAEPENQSDWMAEVASVELERDERIEVGSRFTQTIDLRAAGRLEYEHEVTDLVEDRVFEYRMIDGPYPTIMRFDLEPVGRGTLVVATEESSPPGIRYLLLRPIVKWVVKRRVSGDLRDLEASLERMAAGEADQVEEA